MFFDLDAAPADLVRAVQRDPTLPDEHIANRLERYALVRMCTPDYLPRWTTLHNGWPASLKPIDPLLRDRWACYELRMGWPLPGLRGAYRSKNREAQPQAEWNTLLLRRAVAWSGRWSKFRSIVGMPLTPDWPPFLADVTFYALICLALKEAPRHLRKRWRRRRGRCEQCGYNLRMSSIRCPECGTRIPGLATPTDHPAD